ILLSAPEACHGPGPCRLASQARCNTKFGGRAHPVPAAQHAPCPGFGSGWVLDWTLCVIRLAVPIRTPLQDASREVEDSIRVDTVRVRSGWSRRVGTAVSRIAAPRVKRVTPGILPRVVAACGTLPFRLGPAWASGPGPEGAGLARGDAGNREGLGHAPDRRLRRRLGRRSQEALVLAPRPPGLSHEEGADADDVPRTLGRLAFGRRTAHL